MNNLTSGTIATNAMRQINLSSEKNIKEITLFDYENYKQAIYNLFIDMNANNPLVVQDFLVQIKSEQDKKEFNEDFEIINRDGNTYLSIKSTTDLLALKEWYLGTITKEELSILDNPIAVEKLKPVMKRTRTIK